VNIPANLQKIPISVIFGFLTLSSGMYLLVVTESKQVGFIDKSIVYEIEKIQWVPLFDYQAANKESKKKDEKFFEMFSEYRIDKDCYYCLDRNIAQNHSLKYSDTRFIWNFKHTQKLRDLNLNDWFVPIIQGGFQFRRFYKDGMNFDMVLIARRSRLFAGTRYRKRGFNQFGDVANEIETEQLLIIQGEISSYLQVRGSVPVFWKQEIQSFIPKPPVEYTLADVSVETFKKHFRNLRHRYGDVVILNALRTDLDDEEKTEADGQDAANYSKSNESELTSKYKEALLTSNEPIDYCSLDVKDILAKQKNVNVIEETCFNLASSKKRDAVIRTNCLDCLDRTNMLQNLIGQHAIKIHQLSEYSLANDETVILEHLSEMYTIIGDQIALQYAGSLAHKTQATSVSTPKKVLSRELLTALTRHYSNSFSDIEKQHALNIFFSVYPSVKEADAADDSFAHSQMVYEETLYQDLKFSGRSVRDGGKFVELKSLLATVTLPGGFATNSAELNDAENDEVEQISQKEGPVKLTELPKFYIE
jgi:phosphatidylinositol 3,5-bisphosphate 5-phosphatase